MFTGRCANVSQGPEGGPMDSLPPILLNTLPAYRTIDQKPKRIRLNFSEYVQLKDALKNVTVSPPSLLRPEIRTRGKGIDVIFNDTLKSNTTYTINFGEAISDLNESNPFPPFIYVFSTGPIIDSMTLDGKVFDAYSREPLAGITVCLYENHSDTAIYKTLPSVISKTDNWGYFVLQNIKPISYRMVAFDDKNNNYRYDAGAEFLAFEDSLLLPDKVVKDELLKVIDPKDTAALLARSYEFELYAFKEDVGKQFLKEYKLSDSRQLVLVFNLKDPEILSFQVNGVDSTDMVLERSRFNDTLTYWITAPVLSDSVSADIVYMRTDSLDVLSEYSTQLKFPVLKKEEEQPKKKKDEEVEKPVLVPTISFAPEEIMHKGITVNFKTLPSTIDSTQIQLWRFDDVDKEKRYAELFTWERDSVKLRTFYLNTDWKVATHYEMIVLPEAFTDIYGISNDSIVKKVDTESPDKYSSIHAELSGIDKSEQIIVQLMDEKKERVLRNFVIRGNQNLLFDYLKTAKYTLRFIRDENKNGIWDPGNFLEKKQAEHAEFYVLPAGEELIQLPENTDIKQNIDVPAVFKRDRRNEIHVHEHDHDEEHDEEHDFEFKKTPNDRKVEEVRRESEELLPVNIQRENQQVRRLERR